MGWLHLLMGHFKIEGGDSARPRREPNALLPLRDISARRELQVSRAAKLKRCNC